jgi:Transposase DDE domain group 1
VFGRLAGYEDVNDAERLRHDPVMRWIVGGKAAHGCAASPSQMGRFETRWLAAEKNLSALADLSGQWIDLVHAQRPRRGVVLDMDSSVSPTHGEQEMSAWNGHYACTCYHPLFLFNQFGDLERCALRPGNVHSADGWDGVLKPVVARYRGKVSRIHFRADAGFANPDVYEFLEAERVAGNVVSFYNKRGTCGQWIKEGKGAIKWTRLSCRSFAANAVRLQLHALAYNLGNFLRTLATPEPIKEWSLTSLKEKLIKIGAKVVSHGRYVAFQMAEVAIPKNLFADILRLIAQLRPPPNAAPA